MENIQSNIKKIPILGTLVESETTTNKQEDLFNNLLIEEYSKSLENNDEIIKNFEIISQNMIKMGFPPKMIVRCFLVNKFKTLDEGVELLSKTNSLWNHKYIDGFDERCFICDSPEALHRSLKTILQNKVPTSTDEKIKSLIKRQSSANLANVMIKHLDDPNIIAKAHLESCPICFVDITKDLEFSLNCQHKFCKDCITSYLEEEIKNSRVKNIKCPGIKCDQIFSELKIKEIVSEEYFQKFQKFQKREEIQSNKDLILCPIKDCEGYAKKQVTIDEPPAIALENDNPNELLIKKDDIALDVSQQSQEKPKIKYICNEGHSFCGRCMHIWHGDSNCSEDQEIKDFAANSGKIIKKCPKCKVWTEKDEGCNHMTCQVCRFEWCWLCEQECPQNHYTQPGPCFGRQFNEIPDPEVLHFFLFQQDHPIIFGIFFVHIVTFYIIARIIRSVNLVNPPEIRRRPSKAALFTIIFCFTLTIWFFMCLFNGFLLIYYVDSLSKISQLRSMNARCLAVLTFFLLWLVFLLPGIIFSTFWLATTLTYTVYKLCTV
jgi:hypothetical protein